MVSWAQASQPPNHILISSTIFARLMNVTNGQTDRHHATPSVATGHI